MNMETVQPKSNKTKYIVIALVVLFLLGTALAIVGVAAGIYFYTSAPAPERTFDAPVNINSPADRQKENITAAIVEQIRSNKAVGSYTLQNLAPVRENRAFMNSDGEAYGIYTAGNKTVRLLVAEYTDKSLASVDFGRMMANQKSAGATIVKKLRSKDGIMDAAFEKDRIKTIAYCIFTAEPRTICHMLSSENGSAITDFSESMLKKK